MVHCIKLKNGKCSFTGGKCIVGSHKTIEGYRVCPERKLAKDYNEMTMEEKAFHNSIENKKKIEELEDMIKRLEMKKLSNCISYETAKLITETKRNKVEDMPKPEGIAIIRKGLDSTEKKKGGFWSWLKRKK